MENMTVNESVFFAKGALCLFLEAEAVILDVK